MPVKSIVHTIAFFLLLVSPVCRAGDTATVCSDTVVNAFDFVPRIPEREQIESYLGEKDFQYGKEYKTAAGEGFFQRLWRSVLDFVAQIFQAVRYLPIMLRILFIVACLVVLFIIATKTKLYRMFYEDRETEKPEFSMVDPLHEQYNFDEAVSREVSLGNYRNAIRLLHLKLLKELDSMEIIRISRDKTNRDYSLEIEDNNIRKEFVGLTRIYNHIWYGKFPLTGIDYESLAPQFLRFTQMLHAGHE